METLETERLILRPLCEDDYLDCFKWCGDARVNEFMIYPLYHKAEDVKEWLKTVNDDERKMCFGYVLKESGDLIGSGSVVFHEEKRCHQIGLEHCGEIITVDIGIRDAILK